MKIGTKLFLTYILLISSIFIVTSISFRIISQRSLMNETKQQLQKEAKVISQLLKKETLSNEKIRTKLVNRRIFVISEKLMTSKIIILNANNEIVYTDMRPAALKQYMNHNNKKNFVSETVPIVDGTDHVKGYATLVAKLSDLQSLNIFMRRSQLISLIISGIIALLLGLIFQNNLTKPIRLLAYKMRNFSFKGENQDIVIHTSDEIKELADSFNMMSRKIIQYDENQKLFFQNASHELKTPLMAIQGNAELILDGIVTGKDAKHSLNVIITESQRLKKIVEGITYLAKLENIEESFHFKDGLFEQPLHDAVKSVRAIAEQRGIRISVENADLGTARMDHEKLKRAFINLLGNALRFAESTIVVNGYRSDHTVVVEIRDDGKGFSPGEEKKVFERFYSGGLAAMETPGGSGIGLAITKAIIEGHNGTITACSNQPKGAIFRVTIPV